MYGLAQVCQMKAGYGGGWLVAWYRVHRRTRIQRELRARRPLAGPESAR